MRVSSRFSAERASKHIGSRDCGCRESQSESGTDVPLSDCPWFQWNQGRRLYQCPDWEWFFNLDSVNVLFFKDFSNVDNFRDAEVVGSNPVASIAGNPVKQRVSGISLPIFLMTFGAVWWMTCNIACSIRRLQRTRWDPEKSGQHCLSSRRSSWIIYKKPGG